MSAAGAGSRSRLGRTGLPGRLQPEDVFAVDRGLENVVHRSVRAGAHTLAAQGARVVMQTLTTVVLARLLSPEDFGLVAMVTLVVGFAQVFKDAGLSTATIQRDTITRDQVSTLFWVNVALGAALSVVLSLLAPAVSGFFRRSDLLPVTVVLSATFFVGGLAIQHEALLRRHLRFGALAVVQTASQATNFAVALAVALMMPSHRYWALVAGAVASVVCSTVLTFYYCPFVPGRMRRGIGVRSMLSFGGNLMGFEFVNYFARNLDNLLVGRFLGAGQLGLYSKAYQLFMLPITQIRTPLAQVALAALSRLQSEPERYRRFCARLLLVTAALTVPVSVYCVIEPEFIVRTLLGGQWIGAARTFQILAVVGIAQPTTSCVGLVMMTMGRTDRLLKSGVFMSLVLAFAFAIGLPFGIEGVAAGFTLGSYVVMMPFVIYGVIGTSVEGGDFVRALWPPIGGATVAGLLGVLGAEVLGRGSFWGHIALVVVFTFTYVGLTISRRTVREAFRMLQSAWSVPVTAVSPGIKADVSEPPAV